MNDVMDIIDLPYINRPMLKFKYGSDKFDEGLRK